MVKKETKKKKENKSLTIFLTTFIVTFAVIALSAKYFSPDIDVEIGKSIEETEEEIEIEKGSVDERLRWIQFEDNMPGVSTRFTDDTTKENSTEETEDNTIVYEEEENQETLKPDKPEKVKPIVNNPIPNVAQISKVYVGNFSTIEQAIATQNQITEAGLDLAPFVKRIDNYYVVQVGSFASPQKAQEAADMVNNAGFSARVAN